MSDFKKAIKVLESLEATSKRNEKLSILKSNKSNKILHTFITLAYDPRVTYGVIPNENPTKYKDSNFISPKQAISELKVLCKALSLREISGNTASRKVNKYLSSLPPKFRKWAIRIFRKNLRIGANDSTFGSVWPDMISDFGVPLCANITEQKKGEDPIIHFEWVTYPCHAEPKYDGINLTNIFPGEKYPITFRIPNQKSLCLSRGQTHYPMVEKLWKKISKHIPEDRFIVSEAYAKWTKEERLIYKSPWSKATSLLKTGMTPTGFKPELVSKEQQAIFDRDFQLVVFEYANNKFYSSEHGYEDPTPRRKRRKLLVKMVKKINDPQILAIECVTIHNKKELVAYYKDCLNRGYEGIIIKDLKAPCTMGRTSNMLKFKPEEDVDGTILGIYKGTGKNSKWGGYMRVYLTKYKIVTNCNLRTDKDRFEFWRDRASLVGMQAEFKKQQEAKGAEVSQSRFIVFKRLREDLKKLAVPKCAVLLQKHSK